MFAQVHDQTLVNINNHLVNGGSNDLDGASRGGGNQLNILKQEILTELERRVSLSCSSCQVNLSSHASEVAASFSIMRMLAISVAGNAFTLLPAGSINDLLCLKQSGKKYNVQKKKSIPVKASDLSTTFLFYPSLIFISTSSFTAI